MGADLFKFLKGCLPQISLGPLLNTMSQIMVTVNLTNELNLREEGSAL